MPCNQKRLEIRGVPTQSQRTSSLIFVSASTSSFVGLLCFLPLPPVSMFASAQSSSARFAFSICIK